jgi:hypothetical protein
MLISIFVTVDRYSSSHVHQFVYFPQFVMCPGVCEMQISLKMLCRLLQIEHYRMLDFICALTLTPPSKIPPMNGNDHTEDFLLSLRSRVLISIVTLFVIALPALLMSCLCPPSKSALSFLLSNFHHPE